MAEFYGDMNKPMVQRLAKAMVRARGYPEDTVVPETGYRDAAAVPLWWKYQDQALNALVVIQELGLILDKSDDV